MPFPWFSQIITVLATSLNNLCYLQCNELSTLSGGGSLSDAADSIQVLDLRCNQFEKLPEEVGALRGLKVLYLKHNR